MLFRITLLGLVALTILIAQKHYDLIHRSGLFSYCRVVASPANDRAVWKQCHKGYFGNLPSLYGDGCAPQPLSGNSQYWRCPIVTNPSGS